MENQDLIEKSVELLRNLIHDEPDFHCPEDKEFLLRFLRAKNFSVKGAFVKLKRYVEIRKGFPNKFHPSAVKEALSSGMVSALKHRDKEGCHVFYFRTDLWNTDKANADEVFVACTLVLEEMLQNVETQQNGVVFLHELKGLNFSHCTCLGFKEMKRMYKFKGGFPAKFKKAHAIQPSKAFYLLFSIIRPFVPRKLLQRATIYGQDMAGLYETIPRECLPQSLGGYLEADAAIDHDLMERLMDKDEYFMETSKIICQT